jgi:hypothetical protein
MELIIIAGMILVIMTISIGIGYTKANNECREIGAVVGAGERYNFYTKSCELYYNNQWKPIEALEIKLVEK